MTDTDSTAISQETLQKIQTAAHDPALLEALKHPNITTVFGAAQDSDVKAVLASVPVIYKETKAGYKTTEFWVAVATLIGVNASGLVVTLPDKWQAAASGAIAVGYALARGLAKKGIADTQPSPVAVAPVEEIVQR